MLGSWNWRSTTGFLEAGQEAKGEIQPYDPMSLRPINSDDPEEDTIKPQFRKLTESRHKTILMNTTSIIRNLECGVLIASKAEQQPTPI